MPRKGEKKVRVSRNGAREWKFLSVLEQKRRKNYVEAARNPELLEQRMRKSPDFDLRLGFSSSRPRPNTAMSRLFNRLKPFARKTYQEVSLSLSPQDKSTFHNLRSNGYVFFNEEGSDQT